MLTKFFMNNELFLTTENFNENIIGENNINSISDLTNYITEKYPNNNWSDIIIDNIIIYEKEIGIYLTVFENIF